MPRTEPSEENIRRSALNFAATVVAALIVMAIILVLGKLAGGVFWIASLVVCFAGYIGIMARGLTFRQKIARWRSKKPPRS